MRAEGNTINVNTRQLHELGKRPWLDNITRDLLDSGTLARRTAKRSLVIRWACTTRCM